MPAILSLGFALPDRSISQADSMSFALRDCPAEQRALLARMYTSSGVERRGSVLLTDNPSSSLVPFFETGAGELRNPSTRERMAKYRELAPHLAIAAARDALDHAGSIAARSSSSSARKITHLIDVSCTGFGAPGIDVALVEQLQLPRSVHRVSVGFMGCFGGVVGLRLAAQIARGDPDARVLVVCTELCSLHYQFDAEMDQRVANALFADGAAACVVGVPDSSTRASTSPDAPSSFPRVVDSLSHIVPGTTDDMSWRIGDHGFGMTLAPSIPGTLAQSLGPALDAWLATHALTRRDVASWAIHPGGPKIVRQLVAALELDLTAGDESLGVLREHGNMSSPTVLFVLGRLLRREPRPLPCVMLAFGPGLSVEAVLVRT
ncbi:MAG: type III polyketide synthase [Planctomycetota bacterium]|nr:type III polyketide synthase [Planctomycetota bacterium]